MYSSQRVLEGQAAQPWQFVLCFWKKVSESETLMFKKEGRSNVRIYHPAHGPSHNVVRQNYPDAYISLPIGLRNYGTMSEDYKTFGSRHRSFQIHICRIRCFWKEPPKFPNTCLPTMNLLERGGIVRHCIMYSGTQRFGMMSGDSNGHVDMKDFMVSYLIPFCTSTPTHATYVINTSPCSLIPSIAS